MKSPKTHFLAEMIWLLSLLAAVIATSLTYLQPIEDHGALTEDVPPVAGEDNQQTNVKAISNEGRH